MNKKLLIPALIIIAAVIGFAVVSATNSSDKSSTDMSGMNPPASSNSTSMNEPMTEQPQAANQVTYKNFAVEPKTLTVKKGTTVTWTNQDDAKHDVTPDVETADFKASKLFGKGETHSVTFNTVGTFKYICSPHPYMKGTIEVTE